MYWKVFPCEAKHEHDKYDSYFYPLSLFLFAQMTKIPPRLHEGPLNSTILPYNQWI